MPISEYLKTLRAKIGRDLVMLPAACVAVIDDQGRLLLGKEAETGLWVLPGGALDPNERPADAAIRECFEETGLLIEITGLIGVFGGPEFLVRYPNGDECYYISTAFRGTVIKESGVSSDGELTEIGYYSQAEFERLATSPQTKLIARTTFANSNNPFFQPPMYSAINLENILHQTKKDLG
ncbi:NUDIX domain-containing protein [Bradyrhizobium sp.]|jgi:8-oxo-dGTP pyrophosphatase MutT (NUDIX family)|uniref:NUDIX domain-containing protein n=1 Tax=Bradyrhizobium sp. TaxID=376 RepID=UPI003C236307